MLSNEPRVMVAVSEHWLIGAMPTTDIRVQDVLNDGNTEFVQLVDVQVWPKAEDRTCVATLSEVVVPKSKIEIVVLPAHEHEAPEKRWNNFTVRTISNVFVSVSNFCVQGELPLPTKPSDPLHALTHQLGRFFPVTAACISGPGAKRLRVPLLFANKEFLNCFHLGALANDETPSVQQRPSAQRQTDSGDALLEQLAENVQGLLQQAR